MFKRFKKFKRRDNEMNDLILCGRALIDWAIMTITFGVGTALVGAVLIIIGKMICKDKVDLLFAFITYYLRGGDM